MKTMLFATSFLALLLLFQSCQERTEEPIEPVEFFGEAKCKLNGDFWNGIATSIRPFPTSPDKHSFEIFKRTTSTHVNFSGFYLALGKFALCQTSTCTNDSLVLANLYHANGDLLFDYYHIAEQDSIENFIEITAYDKTTGDVGGNFQAVFEVDTAYILANGSTLFGAPNTIFMRNGSFSTKLIQ
jgi:hypothetical protein